MSRILMLLIAVFVILFGITFHLLNDQRVEFDFFLASGEFYFSVLMVAAFIIGAVLGMVVSLPIIIKLKRKNAKLLKQVTINEKELDNLRVIPIKDGP